MDNPINPLIKSINTVVKLYIADENGEPIQKPFKMKVGKNTFNCIAVHIDGSEAPFAAFWTCPIGFRTRAEPDFFGVLGSSPKESVTLSATNNQETYTELGCWLMFPEGPNTQAGRFPRDSTGFDYSAINQN